jgi:hypothetical protein
VDCGAVSGPVAADQRANALTPEGRQLVLGASAQAPERARGLEVLQQQMDEREKLVKVTQIAGWSGKAMDAERVELQIAALLDKADVDQARLVEAITELKATGVVLSKDVTTAAGAAVKEAFTGLQTDIERARRAMKWFSYRWFFITVATLAGVGVLAFFMMWVSLTWQRDEVNGLLTQRATLKAEIVQLEGDVAELEKKQKALKQPRRVPKATVPPGEAETE